MKKIYFALLLPLAFAGSVQAQAPAAPAPLPTAPADDVISMFSGAYTNVTVNTWRTDWSGGALEEVNIAGDDVKKYTGLGYVGIETVNPNQIDATGMTYFNLDVWSPNFTTIHIKLVDFGADNAFNGGDDVEAQVSYPGLSQNAWHTIKIPMSAFTALATKEHISQLILSSEGNATVFVDNVYFSNEDTPPPAAPTGAAPDPTVAAADVISLFSGVYTNVPVDSWHTEWSEATLEEVEIEGNATKKYSNLSFNGVETVGANALDVTDMTYFNLNVWSSDFTQFRIKIVDFGADNTFGGGDDSEHEITYDAPVQGQWISYHIPMSSFTGLTSKGHISQFIFASNGTSTVYVDNVYFNSEIIVVNEPLTAAPDPIAPADEVISLFSGVYTNQTVENWHTDWSTGSTTDLEIQGNATKKYGALGYVGTDIGIDNQIDISDMGYLHMDVWSADFTTFTIKMVDFGANGVYNGAGSDDSEGVYIITGPAQGEWVSLHIPISGFTGLADNEHISQFVFVSEGGATVYADNIYFSENAVAGLNEIVKNKFIMYPNPANDILTLQAGATIEKLSVYNMLGQLVLEAQPKNADVTTINVSHLQSGTYIVHATVDGAVSIQKFIRK
ncbi:T9SS type A sorting domain-containing protein [Flavobacterium hauense]